MTLILLTVSQFKDVDEESDKPYFIRKNAIPALPTTFETVGFVNSNIFSFKERQIYRVSL
jgi:hypothetical protein